MSHPSRMSALDRLTGLIETTLKLPAAKVDADAALPELGIDSIIMMELIDGIAREFGQALTPAQFAGVGTLRELAALLDANAPQSEPDAVRSAPPGADLAGFVSRRYGIRLEGAAGASVEAVADALISGHADALIRHYGLTGEGSVPASAGGDIALVGLSCLLPDAPDAGAFWRNLMAGKNSVRQVPEDRWRWEAHYADAPAPGKTLSKWGALVDGVDGFDAAFFNIPPAEARAMDPQLRLLLQQAYRAVEDAGVDIRSLAGSRAGVFVGYQYSEYEQLLRGMDFGTLADGPVFTSSSPTYYLANRLSHAFDLRGPSEAINVNCASSAVAINRAYYSLLNDECDLAIVGGVSLNLGAGDYVASSQYGLLSPDGSSGVFDDDASGFTRGEGVGVIVLKRLADARRDGDRAYCLIKSCHQNHRGAARSLSEVKHESITAALADCYRKAGVEPGSVRYIEVDGYARKWADSFEFEGVKNALGQAMAGKRCALGSVKGNIGNVEAASGVVNVIKLALSLRHGRFPATISMRKLSSFIDIADENHPLYIADREIVLDDIRDGDQPIRAGVNSFADSGSNVHILLEECLEGGEHADDGGEQLFVLSARTPERLAAYLDAYLSFLDAEGANVRLADLAYTSQLGREPMDVRLAVEAGSIAELRGKLASAAESGGPSGLEARGIYYAAADPERRNPLAGLIGGDIAAMQLEQARDGGRWGHVARLWVHGVEMPWRALWRGRGVRPVSAPGYPFAGTRHWLGEDEDRAAVPAVLRAAKTQASAPDDCAGLDAAGRAIVLLRREAAVKLGLAVGDVATDRPLIELGLGSVDIMEMMQRTDAEMGVALSPADIFRYPGIAALASRIAALAAEREPRTENGGERLVPMRTGGGREPIVALPGAGGGALSLQLLSRELGDSQPFYCVEPAGGASSVEETAAANIRLLGDAGLQGPCRLLGYSNGGVVAYEMARQLLAMGRQVSSVILLDTLRPDLRGYGMAAMMADVFRHFSRTLGAEIAVDAGELEALPAGERGARLHALLGEKGIRLPYDAFQATFDIAVASEGACRAYRPQPLPDGARLTLIRAGGGFAGAPEDYGWSELAAGRFGVFEVAADHFSIVTDPAAVAEAAKRMLQSDAKPARKPAAQGELAVSG